MKKTLFAIFICLLPLFPLFAEEDVREETESAGPERGLSVRGTLGAKVNPLGASLVNKLYYTEPLYGERSGVLWDSARMQMGITNDFTPAYDDLSIELFVEPVAFFDFRVNAGVRTAYNLFGYGFSTAVDYEEEPEDPEDALETGWFIRLAPTVKAALGPLVFLNSFTWSHFSFDVEYADADAGHFYEPVHNVVIKNSDSLMKNSTTLLYNFPLENETRVLTGLEYALLYVPGSEFRRQELSFLGAVQIPFEEKEMSVDGGFLLKSYIEDSERDFRVGDLTPGLQIGITKKL
ncbi:MAG: hypothetical protein ACLFSA_05355 [Spirochaetaceae bacterium]